MIKREERERSDSINPIRIGFVYIDPKVWTGGYNYYTNLFLALNKYCRGVINPVLFIPTSIDGDIEKNLMQIPGLELVKTNNIASNRGFLPLLKTILWGKDNALALLLEKHSINIFFENARFIGWRINMPIMAWIPDLQHKFLPKYFSALQLFRRELGFRFQVWAGRDIVLSSDDARNSFLRFYTVAKERVSVVRFAVPSLNMEGNDVNVMEKYGLRQNYVYMPNQFWLHKNHALVIEALKLYNASQAIKLQVVCTGNTGGDNSAYFANLQRLINTYDLQEDFKILGMVVREDVYALIKHAGIVLNPSLFEGWSTTVEEFRSARSLMLLSDLPVHREQMGDQAIYFNPNSAEDLCSKLNAIINNGMVHETADSSDNEKRMQRFADDFVFAVKKAYK